MSAAGFAGRLPVLVMLGLLGLPAGDELLLRRWYDAFEAALANTGFDPQVRRLSNLKWTGGIEVVNQFVDGYPFLVTSEASLAELNRRLQAAGHAPVGGAAGGPAGRDARVLAGGAVTATVSRPAATVTPRRPLFG